MVEINPLKSKFVFTKWKAQNIWKRYKKKRFQSSSLSGNVSTCFCQLPHATTEGVYEIPCFPIFPLKSGLVKIKTGMYFVYFGFDTWVGILLSFLGTMRRFSIIQNGKTVSLSFPLFYNIVFCLSPISKRNLQQNLSFFTFSAHFHYVIFGTVCCCVAQMKASAKLSRMALYAISVRQTREFAHGLIHPSNFLQIRCHPRHHCFWLYLSRYRADS